MPVPLRSPAPVTIIYGTPDPPVIAQGTVVRSEGDELDIEVDTAGIPAGARLILQFGGADAAGPRAVIVVRAAETGLLHTRLVKTAPPDKREYPRVHGAVHVRYRVAPGDDAEDAWMRGEDVPGAERVPDPFMNFSATGLAFDDRDVAHEGDVLLVDFDVPQDPRTWRATARVVRVAPIPIDERDEGVDATHRVAIAFERISEDAVDALGRYTLRIQDAWLEGAE